MKKFLSRVLFGANIFFILIFVFGLYVGFGGAMTGQPCVSLDAFWGTVLSGILFYGALGYPTYYQIFVLPSLIIGLCIARWAPPRWYEKHLKLNIIAFLSFIFFYMSVLLILILFYF